MSSDTKTKSPPAPPAPIEGHDQASWCLDPDIAYLNHGCFGARSREVVAAQQAWRDRFEERPFEVLDRRRDEILGEAKAAVGRFCGMRPENFGFVTNATAAINAVLRSMVLEPGDELVTVNHVYNAVRQTMSHVAARSGAESIEIDVRVPVRSPDEIVEQVAAGLGDRTRLLIVDHVSSPTAILFPIRRLIELGERRGVPVLVDGAHAPGMLDLDVESLGASYYAANLHKWVGAPVGAAFLWARPDHQAGLCPNVISHFHGQPLADAFSWQGTRDITPWLCCRDAIEFGERIGWDAIRRHNHEMAVWVQAMLSDAWSCPASTPLDGSMLGSMVTLPLPDAMRTRYPIADAVRDDLYEQYRIEVPTFEWNDRWWIRPCCQIYNRAADFERLRDAVGGLGGC